MPVPCCGERVDGHFSSRWHRQLGTDRWTYPGRVWPAADQAGRDPRVADASRPQALPTDSRSCHVRFALSNCAYQCETRNCSTISRALPEYPRRETPWSEPGRISIALSDDAVAAYRACASVANHPPASSLAAK
jgi:hypothetical protein